MAEQKYRWNYAKPREIRGGIRSRSRRGRISAANWWSARWMRGNQAVPLSERTRRIGDIARVDLIGRMHRVEERQCLRGQVRAHKGVVSLPHMLRDSAHELAHAPVHLLQHGQAR